MRGAQLICPENARLSSSILAVKLPRLKQQEALAPSLRLGGKVGGPIPLLKPGWHLFLFESVLSGRRSHAARWRNAGAEQPLLNLSL